MKESVLRKTHRNLGIILAFFLLLQGGSGLLLSAAELFEPTPAAVPEAHGHAEEDSAQPAETGSPEPGAKTEETRHGLLGRLHHGQGTLWNLYRLAVGSGLLVLLASGTAIYLANRARQKPASRLA